MKTHFYAALNTQTLQTDAHLKMHVLAMYTLHTCVKAYRTNIQHVCFSYALAFHVNAEQLGAMS